MKKETGITALILCVFVVLAGFFYLRAGERTEDAAWQSEPSETEAQRETLPADGIVPENGQADELQSRQMDGAQASDCAVYICGAVKHPGVYYFSPEARVCDAVLAAGGFTKKADIQAVNQARVLADGEQITIPDRMSSRRKGRGSPGGSTAERKHDGERININTAERAELMTIPGIGEAKAQMILDYRTENGSFRSTEDIMKISGIKEGIYNQIKDYIIV